jgi:hypothetical protein
MSHFSFNKLFWTILIAAGAIFGLPSIDAQNQESPTTANSEDVNIRYARKRLELAKADLEIAVSQNQRTPYVYSPLSLMRLTGQVSQAELLLENSLQNEPFDSHSVHIKCVELSVEMARKQLDWISEASKSLPEMFHGEQVKRFRLGLELNQLALERAKDPPTTASPTDHLRWQIDQLQSEILLLKLELEEARSRK